MSKNSRAGAGSYTMLPQKPDAFLVRRGPLLAGGIVVLAALAAYHDSFSGPFTFDDRFAVADNPSIRQLGNALSPPPGATTGGRPLLNLTFALNYALGGTNVWGYHAFNLLVHTLAGLTLFGIVRRTLLERPTFNIQHPISKSINAISQKPSFADATLLALAVAVIWVVHPLQTEAVTYISQRAESLMGLFFLLTLYCFIRGVENRGQRSEAKRQMPEDRSHKPEAGEPKLECEVQKQDGIWNLASVLWLLASGFSCLLGVMTKEVIVTAPVTVLLYDYTFVAGSFREAWRLRWRYYLGLMVTWLPLAYLMTGLNQRGVGFDQKVTGWSYALTSCRSIVLYLKLAVWPHPLVFDYGAHIVQHAAEIIPHALVLAALLAAVLIAFRYWPAVGFAGAWFFIILAPTSSIIPVAKQPMAEHRMYLSLAALVALGVLGLHRLVGQRGLIICVTAAVGLDWLTIQRNHDYRSELTIWNDTVAKCPDNERAHSNFGHVLLKVPGRLPDAIAQFQAAVRIKPDSAEAHYNLGTALRRVPGRLPEAIAQYKAALQINPDYAEAHYNLGNALFNLPGRLPDAIAQYEAALRINPGSVEAHYNLGNALLNMPGRLPEAIIQYKEALRLKPDLAPARDILDRLQNPNRPRGANPPDSPLRR